jgi:O-antigen/teichoic acid export membrane protein
MTDSPPQLHGRLLARNTALNLVGFGSPMLVALVAVPLLVRGLGPERFGVLALAWMALLYLGDLGFGSTTTRFAARALGRGGVAEIGRIAWTTAFMQAALGLVEGVALWLATPWLVQVLFRMPPELWPEAQYCFRTLALVLPAIGVSRSFMGVLEAGHRFDLVTAVRLPATLGGYLLPLAGLAAGWGLPGAFTLLLVSRLMALAAYFVLALRTFRVADWRPAVHREHWRPMLTFGGWTAVSSVISPLLVYADRLLIGALLSVAAVGYYAAPFEVIARLGVVPMAMVAALFPAFSQLVGGGEGQRAGRLAARSVKLILLALTPLVLLLVGAAGEGLRVWLGDEFAVQSALALQILAVGVLANAAAQVPLVLLHSSGRPDIVARFHLLELPIHVALAWWLIGRWGITGAAAAWTFRVMLDAALLFGATHRLSLLRLGELTAERALRAGGLALGGVVVALLVGELASLPLRLAVLSLLAVGVLPVLWRYGMHGAERSSLITTFRSAATP